MTSSARKSAARYLTLGSMLVLAACEAGLVYDPDPLEEAGSDGSSQGSVDAGSGPHGSTDAGPRDDGERDGGSKDGGASDGVARDGGSTDTGASCPLPSKFKWTSTGPLANPKSPAGHNFASLKDFTGVHWNNQYVVYATVFDATANGWNMVNFNFSDWSQADTVPQYFMANSPTRGGVAPTLFYFTPKNLWVLAYQWGFTYSTTTDPTQPSTWSPGKSLLSGGPGGAIDQTVLCDSTSCYLFFAGDNGNIYQSKMPIADFPGTFQGYKTIMTDTTANLFEAVQVYTVKGTPTKYLMIVEAMGAGGRYFRSFTAPSLDGPWTPLAATESNPFAGKTNVTFANGDAWTNDISHGDMIRNDPSETQTIDPCNMQFLYQGFDKNKHADYGLLPYRPALLTLTP